MIVLLYPLVLFGPIIVAAATHPPSDIQQRIATLRGEDAEVSSLPKVKIARLNEVLHARLEDSRIAISVTLNSTDNSVHLVVPNLRGTTQLSIFKSEEPGKSFESFQFRRHDSHDPKLGETIVSAAAVGPQTILARDYENDRYQGSIQFVQDGQSDPITAGQDSVRLLIHRSEQNRAGADFDLRLGASDFVQLRKLHEAEVDQYLRPLLRELDQEPALFAVPAAVAWQALGDASGTDPALRTRVEALLKDADSESFPKRQAAIDALKTLGADAQPLLRQWDRSKLSVQQASVLESLLADAAAPVNDGNPGDHVSFLLDVLFTDDLRLKQLTIRRLAKLTAQKIDLADARDAASVQRLRDRLMPTTSPAD